MSVRTFSLAWAAATGGGYAFRRSMKSLLGDYLPVCGDDVIERAPHRVERRPDKGLCYLHHLEQAVALLDKPKKSFRRSGGIPRIAYSPGSAGYVLERERFV